MPRRRDRWQDDALWGGSRSDGEDRSGPCWLCGRALGTRVEWHHPVPKSRGGRETVPVHPICHRGLHAQFTNRELDDLYALGTHPRDHARLGAFLRWIAHKPPDFHAPTRGPRVKPGA